MYVEVNAFFRMFLFYRNTSLPVKEEEWLCIKYVWLSIHFISYLSYSFNMATGNSFLQSPDKMSGSFPGLAQQLPQIATETELQKLLADERMRSQMHRTNYEQLKTEHHRWIKNNHYLVSRNTCTFNRSLLTLAKVVYIRPKKIHVCLWLPIQPYFSPDPKPFLCILEVKIKKIRNFHLKQKLVNFSSVIPVF